MLNDWDGLVIKNGILGIEKTFEDQSEVVLKVGGGVVWHQLVMHAVGLNLGGIENLTKNILPCAFSPDWCYYLAKCNEK